MTVTVIIIIAIIVVLAVLVLLLLGMRAMNIGSHEDEYEDEYDEDSDEDHVRGRQREDDEEPVPRGRSRRARQDGGGRVERRPRKRRRDEDWDDEPDSMSDNDFWSSLSEDGPESSGPRNEDRSPSVTAYEYEDDYDDFQEEESGPPGATTVLPAARGREIGPSPDLAMLASLGQSSGPQVPEQADRPSREDGRHRHGQGSPGERALPPGAQEPERSALPPAPPLPSNPTSVEPARPVAPAASTSDDPLGPGSWSPGTPSSTPAHDDPLSVSPLDGYGASAYDSGAMSRSDYPGLSRPSERSSSDDPLAPSFRPTAPDPTLDSPIWSTLDTGSYQRSDLGFGGPNPTSEPTNPISNPHDPLSSGYHPPSNPSYDTGPHTRSTYATGSFGHSELDTGSHTRTPYDTGSHSRAPYDTGAHTRDGHGLSGRNEFDTGSHTRAPYDTGSYQRSDLGFGGPNPTSEPTNPISNPHAISNPHDPLSSGYHPPSNPSYDTGSHTRTPYDTGSHSRAAYQDPNPPLWGGQEGGATPGASGGMSGLGNGIDTGGMSLPAPGTPSPFNQGPGVPPTSAPAPGLPSDALGYPGDPLGYSYGPQSTSGYPTDQLHGGTSPGVHPRQDLGHPAPGSGGGYSDPLDRGLPPGPQAGQYGGRTAGEDWSSGGEDRYSSGPQAPGRYPADPYGAPGDRREGYKGGYEDGRFI